MIYILRNGQQHGPYTDQQLLGYVNSGHILLSDAAIDSKGGSHTTVRQILSQAGLKPRIQTAGSILTQIQRIGTELIIPKTALLNRQWMQDHRMLMLAAVGLAPSVLMLFPISGFFLFYLVALYFSVIWGIFFYYFFKTPQVNVRTTMAVFFLTQVFVFVVWDILGIPRFLPAYWLVDLAFPLNAIGFIFGVGLTEELAKAVPLLIIARRAREPLVPQTLVYYGLMSGIAFGVFEGVQYQMDVNIELDYDWAFFMNIARLTSLPFLHAVWCGIAGYFIAFAKLYPKYRYSLYLLAIGIPALLHGLYDTFCGTVGGLLVAIPIMLISVFLLVTYLKQGVNYQSKLRN